MGRAVVWMSKHIFGLNSNRMCNDLKMTGIEFRHTFIETPDLSKGVQRQSHGYSQAG
jgi:hypothetical protein